MKPDDGNLDLSAQLGFDGILEQADEDNRRRIFERDTAHLPGTMAEALPFYRCLIEQHHAAMLAADIDETMRLREEAHNLALKLNDGEPGILAHDDAPGYVLERETAAPKGTASLWGQQGEFIVEIDGMKVRVELDGMFGTGGCFYYWPGFSAHAVDRDKPFLGQTGYHSFLGIYAEEKPGITPELFVRAIIGEYVSVELRGRLVDIEERHRVTKR